MIESESLETLNLNRLRRIENGGVYLKTPSLCLVDSIDWQIILSNKSAVIDIEHKNEDECCKSID